MFSSPVVRLVVAGAIGAYTGHYIREQVVNRVWKPATPPSDNVNAAITALCAGVTTAMAGWALGKV